jgi:hypothetical protein
MPVEAFFSAVIAWMGRDGALGLWRLETRLVPTGLSIGMTSPRVDLDCATVLVAGSRDETLDLLDSNRRHERIADGLTVLRALPIIPASLSIAELAQKTMEQVEAPIHRGVQMPPGSAWPAGLPVIAGPVEVVHIGH